MKSQAAKHLRSSDADWETFGATDPYFAVLTDPKFHAQAFSDEARDAFFASGAHYVDQVFAALRLYLGREPQPGRALDFGCGVGRLLIPLAARFAEVVGVDVSPSMMEEARQNCRALANVTLRQGDDRLSLLDGAFDFINSYIVLQHIPPHRGEHMLARMVELLKSGGMGAIHLTYGAPISLLHRQVRRLRRFPALNTLNNLLRARPLRTPNMQMNPYPMNRVLALLQTQGCGNLHLIFTEHNGNRGCLMLFQKQPAQTWSF